MTMLETLIHFPFVIVNNYVKLRCREHDQIQL